IEPGGRILEIGAGTGIATEAFARRGFRILGLEPGAAMRAEGRARLGRFADVELAPFGLEDWPLADRAFHLVLAAQPFHLALRAKAFRWAAPGVGCEKSAAALGRDGARAVFGHSPVDERTPLRADLDRAYERHAPALLAPMGRGYSELTKVVKSFDDSGRFGKVELRTYPWSRVYTPDEYLDLMRTHSPHRMLPEEQREALHAGLRAAIER